MQASFLSGPAGMGKRPCSTPSWQRRATTWGELLGYSNTSTAVYKQVPEGYIAFIEELPGANTQGDTLEEARANLREAVELVLEANRELSQKSLEGRQVTREASELQAS